MSWTEDFLLWEEHAREVLGKGPEWKARSVRYAHHYTVPVVFRPPHNWVVRVWGAVVPVIKRGPFAGRLNWRALDRMKLDQVEIREADHQEWLAARVESRKDAGLLGKHGEQQETAEI